MRLTVGHGCTRLVSVPLLTPWQHKQEAMTGEAKGNFIPFLTISAVVEPEPRGLDNRLLRITASDWDRNSKKLL